MPSLKHNCAVLKTSSCSLVLCQHFGEGQAKSCVVLAKNNHFVGGKK